MLRLYVSAFLVNTRSPTFTPSQRFATSGRAQRPRGLTGPLNLRKKEEKRERERKPARETEGERGRERERDRERKRRRADVHTSCLHVDTYVYPVHVCMYVCVYIPLYIYIHTCVCTCMCMCMCMCICMRMCMSEGLWECTLKSALYRSFLIPYLSRSEVLDKCAPRITQSFQNPFFVSINHIKGSIYNSRYIP